MKTTQKDYIKNQLRNISVEKPKQSDLTSDEKENIKNKLKKIPLTYKIPL